MEKWFCKIAAFLLIISLNNISFAKDRRRDFNIGHYREAFSYSFDSADLEKTETNYDIVSLTVRRKTDNIVVMICFDQPPVAQADDKIVIMIDNRNLGIEKSRFKNRGKKNAASKMTTSSSIEYYAWETMAQGINEGNINSATKWIYDEKTNLYTASSPVLIYNIPTSAIRDDYNNHLSTDELSIIVTFSKSNGGGKYSVMDALPYSACKISSKEEPNDTLHLDFSLGLEIPPLTIIR